MHRDIRLGNFLRLVDEVDHKPFAAMGIQIELLSTGQNEAFTDNSSTRNSFDRPASVDAEEVAERALSDTLEISSEFRAAWIDADMTANLMNDFQQGSVYDNVPGTEEFQSWAMQYAIEQKEPYAHSPLDDLHSFFWTTLWAIMNNKNQVSENKDESVWRRNLRGTWSDREGVMFALSRRNMDSSYSPMVVNMRSFMGAWKCRTDNQLKECHARAVKLFQSTVATGDDVLDMHTPLMLRGVADYFELVLKHEESMEVVSMKTPTSSSRHIVALLKWNMLHGICIDATLRLVNFKIGHKPSPDAKSMVELVRTSGDGTQAATDDVDTLNSIEEPQSGDAKKERFVDNAEALGRALEILGISNKCRAVWTDADMAVNLNSHFDREREDSEVQGTKEFLSRAMRAADEWEEDYAHGPLDDLHSFFWTTLWATLNNKNQIQTARVVGWQCDLRGTWKERGSVMDTYSNCNMNSSYGPMIISMQSFLGAWRSKMDNLLKEGHVKAAELSKSAETLGEDMLNLYKYLALRGITEYFELVLEYEEPLRLWM
ncbi:hypothetical protein CYLTODRAFT_494370 [Cylindrobasidium torrendii FP15055 ss-10]|uniref:Fungal-type protein kinase domain-containing protein n=1 Tax=Cylindrobasidium torrendii FP15055 ss-10 TaxID=1314674 RepID=A0A0D7AWU2_9AGAR|nr:hypothetical protein CYLTODRAFT_494370 [Cylindrobasidium torrendii FP15055 ss-10]